MKGGESVLHTLGGHRGCIRGCRPCWVGMTGFSSMRFACARGVYEVPSRAECSPKASPLVNADYARTRVQGGIRKRGLEENFAAGSNVGPETQRGGPVVATSQRPSCVRALPEE